MSHRYSIESIESDFKQSSEPCYHFFDGCRKNRILQTHLDHRIKSADRAAAMLQLLLAYAFKDPAQLSVLFFPVT